MTRGGLRLGRLFGIDIAIDWSWLLICLLMTWNLTALFLRWHPSWTPGMSLVIALVATLLFFGSVLAHELAHSLVAGSFGVRVRGIRLFLFGGVASIDGEPPSATAEFWIAIVGPLVSFGIGLGFFVAAMLLTGPHVENEGAIDVAARLGPIETLFMWLGPVNIMVGLFNLIPGFPLDGGRVLRAILWRISGDLHKATLTSSLVGRGIGWLFILLGISMVFGARIPFFGQGPVSGIWLAFIGWFLSSMAERSYDALLVQDALHGVRVSTLMRRRGWAVPSTAKVASVVNDFFMRSGERAFPIVDDERLVGLVCVGDVRKVPQDAWSEAPITAIMTPRSDLVVTSPNEDVSTALRKLGELDVDQLPVLDGEILVGMLTRNEVARWIELHVGGPPHTSTPRHA